MPDPETLTEEDVRSRLIPYLGRLGIGPQNIRTESSFHIRLGRIVVEVGSERTRTSLAGRLDVLVKNDHGENLFVVEVKAPTVELTDDDRDQGISYARLLDQIAPFVLVTNGEADRLYDSVTKQRLDLTSFPNDSPYWASGRDPASITGLDLRYEAMRFFLGYSPENVLAFCRAQHDTRMRTLRGSINEGRKYVPSLYVSRPAVRETFELFLTSPYTTFALIGGAGVGKTNELCALAETAGEQHIALFFNGAELFDSLGSTLAEEFNWNFAEQLPVPQIVRRLNELVTREHSRLLIFIDAVDEVMIPGFERELSEFSQRLDRFAERAKLIISCKRDEWERFSHFRGSPSPLALTLFPVQKETHSTEGEDGSSSGPYELGLFDAGERDAAVSKYAACFKLGYEPVGALRERCRLPFLLRVVSDVYAGRAEPLPRDIAEPDVIRRFVEQRLIRTPDPDRARRELDAVGRALVQKARTGLHGPESRWRFQSISEREVRDVAGVPAVFPIAGDLVSTGLLERSTDSDGRTSLRFYYNRVRDYVIARRVLELDKLSPTEFSNELPELLRQPIVQDAALWHAFTGNAELRTGLMKFTRGMAALFLETYEQILSHLLPGLRALLDPYTDGPIGLAYWVDASGLNYWGVFAAFEAGPRFVEINPDPSDPSRYPGQFFHTGVHILRPGGKRSFLNSDPREIAVETIWDQVSEAVTKGGLNEGDIILLAEETALCFTRKLRNDLGLPSSERLIDWTEGLLPLDCNELLRRIQVRSGTDWHREVWIQQERSRESPWITPTATGYSIRFPDEIHRVFEDCAERDVAFGRQFRVTGTWEFQRLNEALHSVVRIHDVITEASLPRPDRPDRNSFDGAYSDDQIRKYIQSLFLKALDAACGLIRTNFPFLRERFSLLSQMPLGVVVEYRRASDGKDSINSWGELGYAFVSGDSEESWVDVHIETKNMVFDLNNWTALTRFGLKDMLRGFRITSARHLFFADGPPIGRKGWGTCEFTPIRSLAYHFLQDDFKKMSSDVISTIVI